MTNSNSSEIENVDWTKSLDSLMNDASINRVFAVDSELRIISWNKTSEMVTGISEKEIIGKPLLDAFPYLGTDEKYRNGLRQAFNGFKVFIPADKSLDHRISYETHLIPLVTPDAGVVGVMNIAHDVSHRIKAEQELQELNDQLRRQNAELARTSAELSTFIRITSDNVKEPVRLMYTGLEFLLRSEGRSLSDTGKASLRRIQSSLNRMNLLINDLLSFAEISHPHSVKSNSDLRSLLDKALDKLSPKISELAAAIRIEGDWPQVNGHADLIQAAFTNILDNAIKFQPEGNRPLVTIHASIINAEDAGMEGLWSDFAVITFRDNGFGFNMAEGERIFTLFEKLNENRFRGSGLGLAVARKIMHMHKGFIKTESVPTKGSTFSLYFPMMTD